MTDSRFKFNQLERFLPVLAAVVVALTLCLSWHAVNGWLPHDDAANYLQTSQKCYSALQDTGLWHGARSCFLERGWRPILFPLTAVPAFILTRGHLHATVALAMLLNFALLTSYLGLLFFLFMRPWAAAAFTLMIATLPWLFNFTLVFYSEMVLLAFLVAGAFHLVSFYRKNFAFHSWLAALFFGLAFCVRPIESTLAIFLPSLWGAVVLLKRRKLTFGKFSALTLIALAPLGVLLFELRHRDDFINRVGVDLFVTLGYGLAALGTVRRFRLPAWFKPVILFGAIVLFWWLPLFHGLVAWVWETSFGDMAHIFVGRGHHDIADMLVVFGGELGGPPFFVLILILAITLFFSFKRRESAASLRTLALGFSVLLPTLFIHAFSPTMDVRRGFIGALAIFITLSLTVYAIAGPKARVWITCSVLAVALCQVMRIIGIIHPSMKFAAFNYGAEGIASPHFEPEPTLQTFDWLKNLEKDGRISSQVATFELAMNEAARRVFSAHLLPVLAENQRVPLTFGYPWNFRTNEEGLAQLQSQHYEFVLLDLTDDFSEGIREGDPYQRLTTYMIERYKSADLAALDMREIDVLQVKNSHLVVLQLLNSSK